MKILLDENIDVRFKGLFAPETYEVFTVQDMKWNGIQNGALLKLLKDRQFNCWIVADKNIPYQQNVSKIPCTIIVLNVVRNTLKYITPLVPSIINCLADMKDIKIIEISE